MSYQPVSGIVPQYSDDSNQLASGFYLKFYIANTTTPLSMATDSTGNTLLVKAKLNPNGLPISNPLDNDTVFIPHVNQNYRLVIYRNEEDANANNTAGAFLNVPKVEPLTGNTITTSTGTQTLATALDDRWISKYTTDQLSTATSLRAGNLVRTPGRSVVGDGDGGDFFIQERDGTPEGRGNILISGTSLQAKLLPEDGIENYTSYGFNAPADSTPRTIIDGASTPALGHRHFGSIIRHPSGRLIAGFRLGPEHALAPNTVVNIIISDDNALTWSAEETLVSGTTGRDQRDISLGLTSSGRIVLGWSDVSVDTGSVGPGNPNVFRLIYSDDIGDTWSDPLTIYESENQVSRLFGSIKEVPHEGGFKLIATAYYSSDTPGQTKSVWFESFDDGLTWGDENVVVDGVGNSEMDMTWIDNLRVCAVTRKPTGEQATLHLSFDGGATWSDEGGIERIGDRSVAPSVDTIYVKGEPYVLIGFVNRNSDQTEWYIRSARELFYGATPTDIGPVIVTGTNDMINASGYQRATFLPANGEMLFIEFKEFNSPDLWSEVRIVRAFPQMWAHQTIPGGFEFTPGGQTYDKETVKDVGDWTPTLIGDSTTGAATYTVNAGKWTQFGKEVTLHFEIILSSKGGLVGNVRIAGLPKRCATGAGFRSGAGIGFPNGYSLPAGFSSIHARARPNSPQLELLKSGQTGGDLLKDTDITDSFTISGTIIYITLEPSDID